MKRPRILFMAILAVVLLLAGVTVAMADHASSGINVTTLTATGAAAGSTDAYSPKQTCGGCHFNCTTGAYTGNSAADKATWCQTGQKKDCTVAGNCPDYESLATNTVTHNQGYGNSGGKVDFQDWTATSSAHGASVGKHSQQGRNEEFTNDMRQIWGVPGFGSGTGMWGRY